MIVAFFVHRCIRMCQVLFVFLSDVHKRLSATLRCKYVDYCYGRLTSSLYGTEPFPYAKLLCIKYTVVQKTKPLHYLSYLCQTVTDLQKSFTDRLGRKFATKLP